MTGMGQKLGQGGKNADGLAGGVDNVILFRFHVLIRKQQYFGAMKKLIFLAACLVALIFSPVMAQTSGAAVVVVQTYYIGLGALRIAITRGEGKTEQREVKSKGNDQVEAVQKVIADLYQQGYSLKGTYGPGNGSQSNFIFVKGQ